MIASANTYNPLVLTVLKFYTLHYRHPLCYSEGACQSVPTPAAAEEPETVKDLVKHGLGQEGPFCIYIL